MVGKINFVSVGVWLIKEILFVGVIDLSPTDVCKEIYKACSVKPQPYWCFERCH